MKWTLGRAPVLNIRSEIFIALVEVRSLFEARGLRKSKIYWLFEASLVAEVQSAFISMAFVTVRT